MKLCPNCGTQCADQYTQCPNCRTDLPASSVYASPQPTYSGYIPPAYQAAPVTTVGGWFGWTLLCSFLPIIGAIIMMNAAKDPTAKNFAKATLIVQIISIILCIIFFALFGAVLVSAMRYSYH